jgi:hypothetical protein
MGHNIPHTMLLVLPVYIMLINSSSWSKHGENRLGLLMATTTVLIEDGCGQDKLYLYNVS